MSPLLVASLFLLTALAEIGGCYLVFLAVKGGPPLPLLAGAALLLGLFAWLLSFHPNAGRAYAAYGGVYIASAVAWGWLIESKPPIGGTSSAQPCVWRVRRSSTCDGRSESVVGVYVPAAYCFRRGGEADRGALSDIGRRRGRLLFLGPSPIQGSRRGARA
jgi:small multidrug resistance family-3 protein